MDTKMLCPTLSMMLVKTIKALCEINIHYDQKLEITGSIHVRSDGNKVLTCLLDEETVKGSHHETAARVAELAARLSLANAAAFTFQHVQMPTNSSQVAAATNVNHSQQVAEALLSTIHNPTANMVSGSEYSYFIAPSSAVVTATQHQQQLQQQAVDNTMLRMSPISPASAAVEDHGLGGWDMRHTNEDLLISPGVGSTTHDQRQNNGNIEGVGRRMPPLSTPRKAGRRVETVAKTLAAIKASNNLVNRTEQFNTSTYQSVNSDVTLMNSRPLDQMTNHIKLPDIQTLAQRLPNFHQSPIDIKPLVQGHSAAMTSADDVNLAQWPPADDKQSPESPDLEISADATTGVEIGTGGKKKFQCMFCGIFLSTKCYLKNHINAVHTRSRIYQCDLCSHCFYSAGAARIHKLRNHWQNAKKHRCAECSETFLLPIELRKHIQKKHFNSSGYQTMIDATKLEPGEIIPSAAEASLQAATSTDGVVSSLPLD